LDCSTSLQVSEMKINANVMFLESYCWLMIIVLNAIMISSLKFFSTYILHINYCYSSGMIFYNFYNLYTIYSSIIHRFTNLSTQHVPQWFLPTFNNIPQNHPLCISVDMVAWVQWNHFLIVLITNKLKIITHFSLFRQLLHRSRSAFSNLIKGSKTHLLRYQYPPPNTALHVFNKKKAFE
jgi:hypothetical protein